MGAAVICVCALFCWVQKMSLFMDKRFEKAGKEVVWSCLWQCFHQGTGLQQCACVCTCAIYNVLVLIANLCLFSIFYLSKKADCPIFALLVGRLVGRSVGRRHH